MDKEKNDINAKKMLIVGLIIIFTINVVIFISGSNKRVQETRINNGLLGKTVREKIKRKTPFRNREYYYSTAENYVKENYNVPNKKNLEGLKEFLLQVELREYGRDSVFTCSEISAMLEWLLEGAGFDTKIVLNYDLSAKTVKTKRKHVWVMVNVTDNDLVAVESKKLTKDNYKPPGIMTAPNGKFKEHSGYYLIYQDWKKKMERNITFENWKKKIYEGSNTWDPEYYSPKEIKEDPHSYIEGDKRHGTKYYMPKDQFDWYNVAPHSNSTAEFSKWS